MRLIEQVTDGGSIGRRLRGLMPSSGLARLIPERMPCEDGSAGGEGPPRLPGPDVLPPDLAADLRSRIARLDKGASELDLDGPGIRVSRSHPGNAVMSRQLVDALRTAVEDLKR